MRQSVLWMFATLMLVAVCAGAQETAGTDASPEDAPADAQAVAEQGADGSGADDLLDAEALETLVGPVALYPDTVLNQVLVAATVPLDIVKADRFLADNADADAQVLKTGIEAEDWDESVAVLATAFPDVLQDMAEHIEWTDSLGVAMLAQTEDVLDAIQTLRDIAVANGALADTEQQTVEIVQGDVNQTQEVVIRPADPQVVYVPSYQPAQVFDSSINDAVVGGLIAFTTVALIDQIFDDNDHWHGYWGCRNCGGWGGRPIIRDPDIDIDVDGNVNIGNRLDLDRDNINIDRDNINIDRDRLAANRGDGAGALAGWKPDRNTQDQARQRIAAKRNPDGATRLPIKKPTASDSVRDKIAARTPSGGARPQLQLPGGDGAALDRPGGNRPQANRPPVNRPQALPSGARQGKKANLREKSTSRSHPNIGKASGKRAPKMKQGTRPHKAFQKHSGGTKARKASARGNRKVGRGGGRHRR